MPNPPSAGAAGPVKTRLAFRATDTQARLLRRAAEAAGLSLSAFVAERASEAARGVLAGRGDLSPADEDWDRAAALLGQPPAESERMKALLAPDG